MRGYDPRTASGTQGVLASLELRSPSVMVLSKFGVEIEDSGQLLGFFDSAFVSDKRTQAGRAKNATLTSAGLGARYQIGRYLDVSFDYGWQLKAAPGAAHRGHLANISLTLGY